jgi:hypothetical protein
MDQTPSILKVQDQRDSIFFLSFFGLNSHPFFFFFFFCVIQECTERKGMEQQAQLLVLVVEPAHGLLQMEIFGSLAVLDQPVNLLLLLSFFVLFFVE